MQYTALKREISKLLCVIMMIGLLLESPIIVSSDSGDTIDIMSLRGTDIGAGVTYSVAMGLGLSTLPNGTISGLETSYGTEVHPLVYDFSGVSGSSIGYLEYTFNGPVKAFLSNNKTNGTHFDYAVSGNTAAQKFTLTLPEGLVPYNVSTSTLRFSLTLRPTEAYNSESEKDIKLDPIEESTGANISTNSIYFTIQKDADDSLDGNSIVKFSLYIPFRCDSTIIRQNGENTLPSEPTSVVFSKNFEIAPAVTTPSARPAVTKDFYFNYADYLKYISVDLLHDDKSVLSEETPLPRLNPHELTSALSSLTFKINLAIPAGTERGKSFDIRYPDKLTLSNISALEVISGVTVNHDDTNHLLHVVFTDDIINNQSAVNGCCFCADAALATTEVSEELGYESVKFFVDNYKFLDSAIHFQKALRNPQINKTYKKTEINNSGTISKGFKWTIDIKPGNIVSGDATITDTFTNTHLVDTNPITIETIDSTGTTVSGPTSIEPSYIDYQDTPNPTLKITLNGFNTYNEAYTYRLTYYTDISSEVWETVDAGTPVTVSNSVALTATALYSLPAVNITDTKSVDLESSTSDWVPTPAPSATPIPTPDDSQPIIIVPPSSTDPTGSPTDPGTVSPTPEGEPGSVTPSPEDSQVSPTPEGEIDADNPDGDSTNTADDENIDGNDSTSDSDRTNDGINTDDNGNTDGENHGNTGDDKSNDDSGNGADSGTEPTERTEINEPATGEIDLPDDSEISEITQPEHGKVTVDDDGKWTYTPDEDYTGEDTFKITILDGNGEEQEIEVSIQVGTDVNATDRLPQTGTMAPGFYVKMGLFLISAGIWIANRNR